MGSSPLALCWPTRTPAKGTGTSYPVADGAGKWIEFHGRPGDSRDVEETTAPNLGPVELPDGSPGGLWSDDRSSRLRISPSAPDSGDEDVDGIV